MASKRLSRLFKILAGAVADTDETFPLEGRLERFANYCALVTRQFIRTRCLVRASALSYSTLLALIPLLVVALSVTSSRLTPQEEEKLTGFVENIISSVAPTANIANSPGPAGTNSMAGGTTNFNRTLTDTNGSDMTMAATEPPPAEAAETMNTRKEIAQGIHDLVQKAGNGALGAMSLIFLLFTAVSLLRGIEETFNDIWGVTRGRSWWLQFMLYYVIITLGPLLLTPALGVTGSLHLQHTRAAIESSPFLAPLLKHLLPVATLTFALGLFYKLTPNTKVEFKAAMLGGLCAAVAWHLYNQLSFLLVARALSASKFYGGVFLIVLLMSGLYILWVIILFGAQIAYAYQNRSAYLQDRLAENINQRGREFVALRVMTCLGRRFQNGQPPPTVPEISQELGVPSRLTQSVLRLLTDTQLVSEIAGSEAAFVPARPLEAINAFDILMAMRTGKGQNLPMCQTPELAEMYGEFARIEQAERAAAGGLTLLALANRQPPPALPEPGNVKPLKTL